MNTKIIYFATLIFIIFSSCEKEIKLDLPSPTNAVVVEGHIENGESPYVLLTKNSSFFGGINLNDIASYFVDSAKIMVYGNNDSAQLIEYNSANFNTLPITTIQKLATDLGIDISGLNFFPPITIYTTEPTSTFKGIIGNTYQLKIITKDNKIITSSTTIPTPVALDSLWARLHPNATLADSFFQVYARFSEPSQAGNYYRFLTKADNGPYLTSSSSVFDDAFTNGKTFDFYYQKGNGFGTQANPLDNRTGYWNIGDSICIVKVCSIDKPHYDFWRTLESSRNSQGNPFGSFVYVKSNVVGGLGIWGGYGSSINIYRRF